MFILFFQAFQKPSFPILAKRQLTMIMNNTIANVAQVVHCRVGRALRNIQIIKHVQKLLSLVEIRTLQILNFKLLLFDCLEVIHQSAQFPYGVAFEDNVSVCVTLRHFESDSAYMPFGDALDGFWIQKLDDDDRKHLLENKIGFTNYPGDKFLLGRNYYIGRGKSHSVLEDNAHWHFFPIFRAMKLFKTADLIMPLAFYCWKGKYRSMRLHGENYGDGFINGNPYVLNKDEADNFHKFFVALESYPIKSSLGVRPYRKPPDILQHIDFRHHFAIHAILKQASEHNNPNLIFDKLVDYTIALESLFLLKSDRDKGTPLSIRAATLLGHDSATEQQITELVKRYYNLRNDIIHASFIDDDGDDFLNANIQKYEDILRRSILAFLDLNKRAATKKAVIKILNDAAGNAQLKATIRGGLGLLGLAHN
jgi:hypothetical protein